MEMHTKQRKNRNCKEHSTTHRSRDTIKLTSNDRHIVIGYLFSRLFVENWASDLRSHSIESLFRSVLHANILAARNPGIAPRTSHGHFFLAVYVRSRSVDGISETETTRLVLSTQTIQYLPYGNFSCWVFPGWFPFDFKTAPVGGSRIFHIFNLKNETKTACTAG